MRGGFYEIAGIVDATVLTNPLKFICGNMCYDFAASLMSACSCMACILMHMSLVLVYIIHICAFIEFGLYHLSLMVLGLTA